MGLASDDFALVPVQPEYRRALLHFLLDLIQYDLETELKSVRFARKMIWESEGNS
jgi:hypothetical protein